MKPPKLDEVLRLMKVLDELYCMYRLDDGLGFTFQVKQLSTGKNYRVSVNPSIAYIEMIDKEFNGCKEFLYYDNITSPFTPQIWNGVRATFSTQWSANSEIRRVSISGLVEMYPMLPADTSLEPDIIDPIIFQNLTRYTMNEVLTQLIALQIYPRDKDKEGNDFLSTMMKLDYRVLDMLSVEELLELIQIVGDEIEYRKNNV